MNLQSFSIENFRSITNAKKIELSQISTLIGKNNEGKSNILNALGIAMEILRVRTLGTKFYMRRFMYPRRGPYIWERDFPIGIQNNNRKKIKETIFRLEFSLTKGELIEFKQHTSKTLNGVLEFQITCGVDHEPRIEIKKTGTNTKSWTDEKTIEKILRYIVSRINFIYIPAIRTEEQAIETIENIIANNLALLEEDSEYKEALEKISMKQKVVLNEIAKTVGKSLKTFISDIKEVEMKVEEDRRRYDFRRGVDILIDDGVKTSIGYKGDGIKSLVALSILKDGNSGVGVSLIAIEEPESHLHPGAIHSLRDVIYSLVDDKKNQVLISTHNPIFTNKNDIKSNIIVDGGQGKPAKNIKEIREILGVQVSDDLIGARYVLLVEGIEDKISLIPLLEKYGSNDLNKALKTGLFVINHIDGASNLSYRIDLLKNQMCKVFVLLDDDDSGNQELEKVLNNSRLLANEYIKTNVRGKKESEFEDLIDPAIYENDILDRYGVDLNTDSFKKSNKKFSDTMKKVFDENGKKFDKNIKSDLKSIVANSIKGNEDKAIKRQDIKIFENLLKGIENMIK